MAEKTVHGAGETGATPDRAGAADRPVDVAAGGGSGQKGTGRPADLRENRPGISPGRPAARSYRDAGVDKEEGYRAVGKMKKAVAATQGPRVLGGLGAFASLYALEDLDDPVLVSGTDGVGTKLRLALDAGRLDVIGRDCYAMVANDILCHGARPLFFLDYLACGKLDADVAAAIVAGMAAACLEEGCALVGGETAEMPGFYAPGDYDVAGFIVGVVSRSRLVDGSAVRQGDVVIGLASDGVHSNGFSLVRALFPDVSGDFMGRPLSDTLLTPTRLYGKAVRGLLDSGIRVHGMAHITGGGIPENLPRAFTMAQPPTGPGTGTMGLYDDADTGTAAPVADVPPPGERSAVSPVPLEAVVDESAWALPPVFAHIASRGVGPEEMRGTFNMGIGFTLVVPPEDADAALGALEAAGERAWRIGVIRRGVRGVCYA